ncbi:MAG: hypothetical protein K6T59_09020 [Bryobacteraceae bacterium]|jgi:hypothetical protein|nr:hypothetical protein [Bryobacteraceae bacterium]
MSRPDPERPQLESEEKPPLLGTWRRVYLAVLGWLAALIVLFYLFSKAFAP